jgi:hypothetical protein
LIVNVLTTCAKRKAPSCHAVLRRVSWWCGNW